MVRAVACGFLLLAALARAQGLPAVFEIKREVEAAIDAGQLDKAKAALDGASLETLAANRDQTWLLLKRAADDAFWIAYCGQEGADLLERLAELVVLCRAKHGDHATVLMADGELEILRARFARSYKGTEGDVQAAASFQSAADLHDRAHAAGPWQGQSAARAVCALVEKAWAAPSGRAALLAAAEERARKLEEGFATSKQTVYARAAVNLERAKDLAPAAKTTSQWAEIKALLEPSLDALGKLAVPLDADREWGAKHQELVEFALANPKAGLDGKFVGRPLSLGRVRAQMPASRYFRPRIVNSGQHDVRFYQWTPEGRMRRALLFGHYRWSIEYTTGPRGAKGVAGDNAKGLCGLGLEEAWEAVAKSKRKRPVTKGRFNDNIPEGYVFEVSGKGADDVPFSIRGYYFKSGKERLTIFVWVEDYGEKGVGDFAGEFFLNSIRE